MTAARGGELNAATALRKLTLVLERTLIRAEADALNAATSNEEQVKLRTTLREAEREGESGGVWQDGPRVAVALNRALSVLLFLLLLFMCVSQF